MAGRTVRRTLVAAITLATSTWVVAADNGVSARRTSEPKPSTIEWEPCFQEVTADFAENLPPGFPVPVYECGNVRVPLDYDRRRGGTISIALVRLPALDPSQKIGSMFLNPGGPGGSGIEFAVFGAPVLYSPDLRTQFDLVGFDPRGIGQSTPLQCFDTFEDSLAIFDSGVVAFPKTRAEARAWAQDERVLARKCGWNGGKILNHMSTANVARDLDRLREAVGDEQLTYAGYSYGSYLGQTYANLFPDRVRALIIDGVLDPIAWSTGDWDNWREPFSSRLESDVGAQQTLDEFFRLCDEAGPDLCAFAPNSADRYDALAAEVLANEPVPINVEVEPGVFADVPFFYGDLIGFSLGAMYGSDSWFFYALDLAFLEANVFGGTAASSPDFDIGGDASLGYHRRNADEEVRYFNAVEGFPAVACADTDNPSKLRGWIKAAGEVSSENYFTQLWTWASSPCLSFPSWDPDRYVGPWDAHTANPVLIASTLYDPATPISGAEVARSLLPNSGLLLVDGWGHTTLGISSCASFLSEQYLVTQELPPDGTVCPQDFNPFELFAGPSDPGALDVLTELKLEARDRFITNTTG